MYLFIVEPKDHKAHESIYKQDLKVYNRDYVLYIE